MGVWSETREAFRVLGEFAKAIPNLGFKMAEDGALTSLGAVFEATADRVPDNVMLLFEDQQWTYDAFNREVNRLARLLLERGVSRGNNVAIIMGNRPEFLLSMLAVVKIGASASLINTSLSGSSLTHCLTATAARHCIVGEECAQALSEVFEELPFEQGRNLYWYADKPGVTAPEWAIDAAAVTPSMSSANLNITARITAGEVALYVFTSGTTGMPKAAVVAHRKILAAGMGVGRIAFQTKPSDRLYLCLPLYHLTGLGAGLCGFLTAGASIYLRRSFSASRFWPEIKQHNCNSFIYVGELCRYLMLQPACPEERNNPLRKMVGNGLRPDVWDEFKARFDVPRICEIYGSSEGNVTFLNLLNKNRTIGAAISNVTLVKYDNENDEVVRDASGACIEVPIGEPGLLLAEISDKARFDGYTNPDETQRKIIEHVREPQDRWFNTGDLIRQIDVGFALGFKHFQFVDRTGDTFRWRAENVSTNEVAEVLNRHPQIKMANVYGVEIPGAEGRAGMAAFELNDEGPLDIDSIAQHIEQHLPVYAQPVFLRILSNAETTVTFKLLKGDLRKEAYHLTEVRGDTVYIRKPHGQTYERLDAPYYELLVRGEAGY